MCVAIAQLPGHVAIRIADQGIGMSIVKEIMALHHGSVVVASAHGQGTTVTLLFPTASSAHHAA